jgi:acetyl esterase/lipase
MATSEPLHQAGWEAFLDIPYTQAGIRKHELDLYAPAHASGEASREALPLVVFVHGGGWKKGDRRLSVLDSTAGMHGNVGRALASQGFACAVVSYRTSNVQVADLLVMCFVGALLATGVCACVDRSAVALGVTFSATLLVLGALQAAWRPWTYAGPVYWPSHAEDVADAVKYLVEHADALASGRVRVDPHRIVLMGHSAGGHIVTMLGLFPDLLRARGVDVADAGASKEAGSSSLAEGVSDSSVSLSWREPPRWRGTVRGIVSMSGVYDAAKLSAAFITRRIYMVSVFGPDPSAWPESFPVARLERILAHRRATGTAATPPYSFALPPLLVANAQTGYDWTLETHTDVLEPLLKEAGVRHYERVVVDGTNHISVCAGFDQPSSPTTRVLLPRVVDFVSHCTASPA